MPHLNFPRFGADPAKRSPSLNHSRAFPSVGDLLSERANERRRHTVHLSDRNKAAVKSAVLFAAQVAVGAIVCGGTILALFALSDISL